MTRVLLVLLVALVLPRAPEPRIVNVAGTGEAGYSGDGGPAVAARLSNPGGITRGPDGGLYICDTSNHVIRRVAPDGTISTVAGTGRAGYAGDGGVARLAELNEPYELRFDPGGSMYIVERLNHVVRFIDARNEAVTTIAGTGRPGFSGDGALASAADLREPHSIQLDGEGDVYVCDIGNHRIRKVDMKTREITTVAGTGEKTAPPDGARLQGAPLLGPRAIDFDREGNAWLALREGHAIYKLDLRRGVLHHAAGTGIKGHSGDGGPARAATFSGPKGISVGRDGNVYIADTENHVIRKLDPRRGTIERVAGTGAPGDGPDGDPRACRLNRPHGIFVDADGAIFIGDSGSNRVRMLRP
jgi:streptogramin lyase